MERSRAGSLGGSVGGTEEKYYASSPPFLLDQPSATQDDVIWKTTWSDQMKL